MSTIHSQICPACKSALNVVYYQRRAADEPPDKVVYCNNCPLDTSRLSIKVPQFDSGVTVKDEKSVNTIFSIKENKKIKKRNNLLFSSNLTKVSEIICLRVDGNAAHRCQKRILQDNQVSKEVICSPVQINSGIKFNTSYYYFSSTFKGKALITDSNNTVAPFVTQKSISVYELSEDSKIDVDKYVLGYEYELPALPNCDKTILRMSHNNQRPYILTVVSTHELTEENKDNTVLSVLDSILVEFGTELSVKSIIPTTVLNTLYIQSGRAYDHPFAPENGFVFTWKPDGERFWYIKYGSIWIYCRRLLSGRIAGWNMCKKLQYRNIAGPILDVEVMIAHDPILIDILADDTGMTMPASRTLDAVLAEFNRMTEEGVMDTSIFVRDYYRSVQQLKNTEKNLTYPVDGIVGIEDGSMTIIKLKTEKSIEVELKEDGTLVSSDQHEIATSDLQKIYSPGSIVEIRFTKDKYSDKPIISGTLLRTDKLKANDFEACKNIFSTISDTPDSLAMRKAVLWCNSIRQKLNQIASRITGKGRVILDIGAGDGQSVSDYSTNPEVTYILLEPNLIKCKRMMRRLQDSKKGVCKLYTEGKSILTALSLVSTGKLKYAVVCATLSEILDQQHCIRTLKSCIRCCIASFSISYIISELQQLSISGITTIGCGYMYDSANSDGILVNENGVVMKYSNPKNRETSREAVVIWGSDKPYTETAIVLEDFKDTFYCRLAKDTVPVANDANLSLLNTISSKVYIISTSKYL